MKDDGRRLFVPADYRELPVMGWITPQGFVPDVPLRSREGFLMRVRPKR